MSVPGMPVLVALTAGQPPAADVAGVVVGQHCARAGQHRQLHVAVERGRTRQAEQRDVVSVGNHRITAL